jgi:hypothetical protein
MASPTNAAAGAMGGASRSAEPRPLTCMRLANSYSHEASASPKTTSNHAERLQN